ncbi:hypothetical protein HDU88_000007 [Geranomyces variabilis]|nr:hypothetical protein HDU88_000007 [Geranomyces variabilis]
MALAQRLSLVSNGDNVLMQGDAIGSSTEQDVQFVYREGGQIAITVGGKNYDDPKVVVPGADDPAGFLKLGVDGVLTAFTSAEAPLWTSAPPKRDTSKPYQLYVENDRRVRIRDVDDTIVWAFPAPRDTINFLQSNKRNYLRSDERITSELNSKLWLKLDSMGLISASDGTAFNDIPNTRVEDLRILRLGEDGLLNQYDLSNRLRWSSPAKGRVSDGPYTLSITKTSIIIQDGKAGVLWNYDFKNVAPPPPTRTPPPPPPPTPTPPPPPPPPKQVCMDMKEVQNECSNLMRTYAIKPFGFFGPKATEQIKNKWWWLNCNCPMAYQTAKVVQPFNQPKNLGTLSPAEILLWEKEACSCKMAQHLYGISTSGWGSATQDVRTYWTQTKCNVMKYCYTPDSPTNSFTAMRGQNSTHVQNSTLVQNSTHVQNLTHSDTARANPQPSPVRSRKLKQGRRAVAAPAKRATSASPTGDKPSCPAQGEPGWYECTTGSPTTKPGCPAQGEPGWYECNTGSPTTRPGCPAQGEPGWYECNTGSPTTKPGCPAMGQPGWYECNQGNPPNPTSITKPAKPTNPAKPNCPAPGQPGWYECTTGKPNDPNCPAPGQPAWYECVTKKSSAGRA